MDTILAFSLVFLTLIISIYLGIPLAYALLLGLGLFVLISLRRGFTLNDLLKMILKGSCNSFIVIRVFILIGVITAVWRACGTVAFIVNYGIASISAQYFILFAFILSCAVSFLLGSSFGTVGTIGIVLVVLGKSGNVDVNVVAGAIIAGAYFGDRCSPMSSSAALVAALTKTEIYLNISNMMKSSIVPFGLSVVCYIILSHWHPLVFQDSRIANQIAESFDISSIVVVPALIIILAAAFKVDIKLSMILSILAGMVIAVIIQHRTIPEMVNYILTGYSLAEDNFLAGIIKGGGLYSMLNVSLIVLISSAYSGIFAGTGILREIEKHVERLSKKFGVYPTTILTSTVSAAFACNQTLAVMLTYQLEHRIYEKQQLNEYRLALDLENTVIMISALIPWNIAGAFPAAALSADSGFILYAYYLLLVPLTNIFIWPGAKNG